MVRVVKNESFIAQSKTLFLEAEGVPDGGQVS